MAPGKARRHRCRQSRRHFLPGHANAQLATTHISDGADGQPLQRKGRSTVQCMALARIDRANAGLIVLLELLHAIERVRIDGDDDQ